MGVCLFVMRRDDFGEMCVGETDRYIIIFLDRKIAENSPITA